MSFQGITYTQSPFVLNSFKENQTIQVELLWNSEGLGSDLTDFCSNPLQEKDDEFDNLNNSFG